MNTKQRNASSVSTHDDEVIVIDDAICEINVRPDVDTSESKKSKGDKSSNTFTRKRLPYVSEAGRSQNSDNDNDVCASSKVVLASKLVLASIMVLTSLYIGPDWHLLWCAKQTLKWP